MPTVEHEDEVKEGHDLSGDYLRTDQYECKVKCCLPNTRGKEDTHKIHRGGTIFVYHASGVIKVHNQVFLGVSDAMRSKELHELWDGEHGISIKNYRRDNGVREFKRFKEDLEPRHKKISYSGVGTHGRNGVA